MAEFFTELLKLASTGKRIFFVVGATAWLFLAIPQSITGVISVPGVRVWVWGAAYMATSFFLFGILYDLMAWAFEEGKERQKEKWRLAKVKKELSNKQAELHNLSPSEKEILYLFVVNKRRTFALAESSTILSLQERDIIQHFDVDYLVGAPRRARTAMREYHISEWAYQYLLKNPHLVTKDKDG